MKIAVIGTDLSSLLCAWLLQDKADVYIFEESDSLDGFCQNICYEENGIKNDIDMSPFYYDKTHSKELHSYLHKLKTRCIPTDLATQFIDYGSNPKIAKAFTPLEILADNPGHLLSMEYWQQFSGLINPKNLPYYATWQQATKSRAPTPKQSWRRLEGSSLDLVRSLCRKLKAPIFFSSNIVRSQIQPDGISLQIQQGGELKVDHVIFSKSRHALNANLPKNLSHALHTISYEACEYILHRWSGLAPSDTRHNYQHTCYYDRSKHASKPNKNFNIKCFHNICSEDPIYLSHDPFIDIPPEYIIKRTIAHLPICNDQTEKARSELENLQGTGNVWFTGPLIHDNNPSRLGKQATNLVQKIALHYIT